MNSIKWEPSSFCPLVDWYQCMYSISRTLSCQSVSVTVMVAYLTRTLPPWCNGQTRLICVSIKQQSTVDCGWIK